MASCSDPEDFDIIDNPENAVDLERVAAEQSLQIDSVPLQAIADGGVTSRARRDKKKAKQFERRLEELQELEFVDGINAVTACNFAIIAKLIVSIVLLCYFATSAHPSYFILLFVIPAVLDFILVVDFRKRDQDVLAVYGGLTFIHHLLFLAVVFFSGAQLTKGFLIPYSIFMFFFLALVKDCRKAFQKVEEQLCYYRFKDTKAGPVRRNILAGRGKHYYAVARYYAAKQFRYSLIF